jgi:hypothetical protein
LSITDGHLHRKPRNKITHDDQPKQPVNWKEMTNLGQTVCGNGDVKLYYNIVFLYVLPIATIYKQFFDKQKWKSDMYEVLKYWSS